MKLVYYRKSTGTLSGATGSKTKLAMSDEKLEADLKAMWPLDWEDMAFSRCKKKTKIELGSTWDPKKKEISAPRPKIQKPRHEHADRLKKLINKFKVEPNCVTVAEIAEYLVKADLTSRITKD